MSLRSAFAPALALSAALAPAPLSAQTPAPPPAAAEDEGRKGQKEQDAPRYRETVDVEGELPAAPALHTTAFKAPLDLQTTPLSVGVVSRPVFQGQAALVLGDALRNVSGVNVATGFGVFDYFVIRGFDSLSSGLVLTDAAPEPESTFHPLYNVRQVEVLKGPAAFLYGGNPLSGAVHLVRKQPRGGRFAEVGFFYGSFQSFEGAADANVARADGVLALRVNAMSRRGQGWRDEKDARVHAVNPALTWRPDAGTRVTANLEYVRSEYQPDSGLPVVFGALASVPRTRSYQSPFDASEQDHYRLRLDVERRLGDRVVLRDKLYYTDLAWRSDGTLIVAAFPDAAGAVQVARTMGLLDDRQRLLGNQLEALLTFSTGGVGHNLLAGVEASRLSDDFTLDVAFLPFISLLAPVETARRPFFLLPGLSQAGEARAVVVAPYLVDQARVSESVRVFAGARLDTLDYEERRSRTDRTHTRLSPMGGLSWSPASSLSLYLSAGAAFAPPSTLVVGERVPEESRQVEVGAKRTFRGGRGFASLALYHLEKDNVAIPDGSGVTRQAGDQRSRGVEVEASAELGPGWFGVASYAFTDAELTRFAEVVPLSPPAFAVVDRSGNRPPFAPRHLAGLWVMKQLASGLGLGAGARYVGRQFIAEDNAFAIEDALTFDALASYKRGRWKWSLNLKNLTGREYETRGFGSASVIPGAPFAAYGRLDVTLGSR